MDARRGRSDRMHRAGGIPGRLVFPVRSRPDRHAGEVLRHHGFRAHQTARQERRLSPHRCPSHRDGVSVGADRHATCRGRCVYAIRGSQRCPLPDGRPALCARRPRGQLPAFRATRTRWPPATTFVCQSESAVVDAPRAARRAPRPQSASTRASVAGPASGSRRRSRGKRECQRPPTGSGRRARAAAWTPDRA